MLHHLQHVMSHSTLNTVDRLCARKEAGTWIQQMQHATTLRALAIATLSDFSLLDETILIQVVCSFPDQDYPKCN